MMATDVLPYPESYFWRENSADSIWSSIRPLPTSVRGLEMALCRNPVKGHLPLHNSDARSRIIIELPERAGFLKGKGGLNDVINRTFMLHGAPQARPRKRYSV